MQGLVCSIVRAYYLDYFLRVSCLVPAFTVVEGHLKHCDVSSLRYDGKMSRMERVECVFIAVRKCLLDSLFSSVIAEFKKPEGPGVMLISLKCGGVGYVRCCLTLYLCSLSESNSLNLTVANRVIK